MAWLKKHDILTKTLCLLIAVALWFYVVSISGVSVDYKVKGISPKFIGMEQLTASKNLMVVGEYEVDIQVLANRQDIIALNDTDVIVEVDVSNVTGAGTYELPYTVTLPSPAYTLKSKNPQKLNVKFDVENLKTVPVKVNTEQLAADGYVVDSANISISPKELKLTGLLEDVEKVSYAEVVFSQKDATANISGSFAYELYDVNGKHIKSIEGEADYAMVDVVVPVLKTKQVPLSLEIQGSDNLKKYVNYTITPDKLLVASEEKIIDQMSSLMIGTVKISEISSGMIKTFTVTPPEGILNLGGEITANAEIKLDGLSKKTVKTTLIELINTYTLPTGAKILPVTTSLDVDILGTDETLAKVNSSNVRAIVDLQSTVLSRGTHPINVSIAVDGVEGTAVANPEDYRIYVEVK